jgi:hypothetical protein
MGGVLRGGVGPKTNGAITAAPLHLVNADLFLLDVRGFLLP